MDVEVARSSTVVMSPSAVLSMEMILFILLILLPLSLDPSSSREDSSSVATMFIYDMY